MRITYLYHILCNYFCLVFLFFRIFHDEIIRRVLTRIRKKVFRMTPFPPAVTIISVILCLLKALVRTVNSSLRGWKGHLTGVGWGVCP